MVDKTSRRLRYTRRTSTAVAQSSTGVTTRHGQLQLPFRFLDLPAELRNAIYEFVFNDSTTVLRPLDRLDGRHYQIVQETSVGQAYHTGLAPLVAINKQIRNEALELFFAHTKFVVCGQWVEYRLNTLMRKLGQERRTLVTRLCHRAIHPRASVPDARRRDSIVASSQESLRESCLDWDLKGIRAGGLEVEIQGQGWKIAGMWY